MKCSSPRPSRSPSRTPSGRHGLRPQGHQKISPERRPRIVVRDLAKTFRERRGRWSRQRRLVRDRRRGIRGDRGAVGLRQVDDPQHDRRPRRASAGVIEIDGRPSRVCPPTWVRVPEGTVFPWRTVRRTSRWASSTAHPGRRAGAAVAAAVSMGRSGVSRRLPGHAVRWKCGSEAL